MEDLAVPVLSDEEQFFFIHKTDNAKGVPLLLVLQRYLNLQTDRDVLR